ncbi:MAG: amino acid ABC transporter permease [Peptococcaceae bacterium]|jgi:polar amino acid transport system permease protein|nr:amino acid ABC transporter permease [Peptococcaceae bacterium]
MNYGLLLKHADFLLTGARLTVLMTVGAILLGLVLGTALGLARLSQHRPLRWIAGVYLQIFRGTPMLLQICFLYFAIPQIAGPRIWSNPFIPDAALAGIIALGMNSGAYIAEIIRAGIQGVDKGQSEAAWALGLSRHQTTRLVVLPQAFRLTVPPLCNEFIVLLKDTSLASAIGAKELIYQSQVMGARYYEYFVFMAGAGVVYFCLTFLLSRVAGYIERRLAVSD